MFVLVSAWCAHWSAQSTINHTSQTHMLTQPQPLAVHACVCALTCLLYLMVSAFCCAQAEVRDQQRERMGGGPEAKSHRGLGGEELREVRVVSRIMHTPQTFSGFYPFYSYAELETDFIPLLHM